jgi:hypothetical protein
MIRVTLPQSNIEIEFLFVYTELIPQIETYSVSTWGKNTDSQWEPTIPLPIQNLTTVQLGIKSLDAGCTNEYRAMVQLSEGDRPNRVAARSYAVLKVLGIKPHYFYVDPVTGFERFSFDETVAPLTYNETLSLLHTLVFEKRMRFALANPDATEQFLDVLRQNKPLDISGIQGV